jgi:hypothetical protein
MANGDRPSYVIIGLGFSAVLNHLLLRSTQKGSDRLGGLPVLHIGVPDPWGNYAIDQMGQWPALLSLPGFSYHHRDQGLETFLPCSSFATATEQELNRLKDKFPGDGIKHGIVEDVEMAADNFRIHYRDRTDQRLDVIAEKIDFCAGLGPPKKLKIPQVKGAGLRQEYFEATMAPAPRRLLTAGEFLDKSRLVSTGTTICVYGGGGTTAWCVERALASAAKEVVWVSREPLGADEFPPSGRNDNLVMKFSRDPETFAPLGELRPSGPRLRLACGYQIEYLNLAGNNQVEVHFQPFDESPVRSNRDFQGNDLGPLTSLTFDQVVVSIGSDYGEGPGCLKQLTSKVMKKKHPIESYSGSLAGLADDPTPERSRLRILGPAVNVVLKSDPSIERSADNLIARLGEYRNTLARQADGALIVTGALQVAQANGFLGNHKPNSNINTAQLYDFDRLGIDEITAENLLVARRQQVVPFNKLPKDPHLASLQLFYDR